MGSASELKPVVTGYPAVPPAGNAYDAYAYPAPAPPSAPYYAAPPPAFPAAYNAHGDGRHSRNTTLLHRLLAVAIGVFIFMGAVSLIIWLVQRPRVPEFAVSSAAVSAFNLAVPAHLISADFDFTLTVYNPNDKLTVHYERLTAGVLYGPEVIAETSLLPFDQVKGTANAVRAQMAAVAETVKRSTSERIAADRAGDGTVSFGVSVYGWALFRSGAWRTRRHVIRVLCEGVTIGFKNSTTGAGSLVGGPKQCRVNL